MSSELGADWQSKFVDFGHEAAAAASLGQVHRAYLPDGTDVACKLQYPNMASTVDADLRQLRLAMAVYHRMDGAIQHDEIYAELAERLRAAGVRFGIEPGIRFQGQVGEQATMFFQDPSGNALEFKAFRDTSRLFAK
jgi:extradiol dioxygenase family protein